MSLDVRLAIAPFFHLERLHPPLGLSYLAAVVRQRGYACRTSDFRMALDLTLTDEQRTLLDAHGQVFFKPVLTDPVLDLLLPHVQTWAEAIATDPPRLLGLSCFRSTRAASFALALAVKHLCPETLIVAGGPDGTLNYEHILRCSAIDAVVLGDAEETFGQLVDAATDASWANIPNLALRDPSGRVHLTPRRPLRDLDSLPFPDFDGLPLADYWATRLEKPHMLPLVGARGCSANCTFCDERTFWPAVSYRRPDLIVEEMHRHARRHNVRVFEFYDLSLNSRHGHLSGLCDALIAAGSPYQWFGMARFSGSLTDALIDKLAEAGCIHLSFGLESGSDDVLRHMRKYANANDTARILRRMHLRGIETHCMVIVGYPTETEEDFLATLRFLQENQEHITSVNLGSTCSIKPGTPLWRTKESLGIQFDERGAWYVGDNTVELRMNRLERLKEAIASCTFHRSAKYDVLNEYKKEKFLRPQRAQC